MEIGPASRPSALWALKVLKFDRPYGPEGSEVWRPFGPKVKVAPLWGAIFYATWRPGFAVSCVRFAQGGDSGLQPLRVVVSPLDTPVA